MTGCSSSSSATCSGRCVPIRGAPTSTSRRAPTRSRTSCRSARRSAARSWSTGCRSSCSARTTTSGSPTTRGSPRPARRAIDQYGTGCTGSRLMNGTLDLHLELEHELADWMQREAALVFTAGYLANLADDLDAVRSRGRDRHRREEPRVDRGRRRSSPAPGWCGSATTTWTSSRRSSAGSRRTGGPRSSSGTPSSRWRATSSTCRACSRSAGPPARAR